MKLRPPKRMRSHNDARRDRLSEMPDELLAHILSFLPTLDAVRTILLRRFGNLWTLVPTLNFSILEFFHMETETMYLDAKLDSDELGRFYEFSRNVLMLNKSPIIDKFHLHVDCGHNDNGSIQTWLRLVLDRQAKEIKYCDVNEEYLYRDSFLPNLTSQYLVTLELVNCTIDPQHKVNLGSLKKLLLDHVVMCEDGFQRLISGCPSLQELGIVEPYDIEKLSFSAPNLHKLCLNLHFEFNSCLLDFPNLKSLDLRTDGILTINDVSSVRDVCVRCYWRWTDMDEGRRSSFKMMWGKFNGVEAIQFLYDAAEAFLHRLDDLHRLQAKWKRVVLELREFCESCLQGICELMRCLEHLEELVLYTRLTGAKELEFVKRLASFRRASTNASVVFAPLRRRYFPRYKKDFGWRLSMQRVI